MKINDRILVLLPLLLSIVGAVLSALCLFAGHKKGYMEDYAIARVNTSAIGQNIFNTTDDSSDDGGGILGDIESAWDHVKSDLKGELNKLGGEIADELATDLGVSEWYSVHIMDVCEGKYKPNATAPHAGLNVTNCTHSSPHNRFNLTKMLDHELKVGPFDLNLADIEWPSSIQDKIDDLNDVLFGVFVVYVLAIVFSGLSFVGSVTGMVILGHRSIVLFNFATALVAAIILTVAAILITVALTKGIDEVNRLGKDVGVSAERGNKFLALTWAAAGSMIVATAIWTVDFCVVWRQRRRAKTRKPFKSPY